MGSGGWCPGPRRKYMFRVPRGQGSGQRRMVRPGLEIHAQVRPRILTHAGQKTMSLDTVGLGPRRKYMCGPEVKKQAKATSIIYGLSWGVCHERLGQNRNTCVANANNTC